MKAPGEPLPGRFVLEAVVHFDATSCQVSQYGAFNSSLITRIAQIPTFFVRAVPMKRGYTMGGRPQKPSSILCLFSKQSNGRRASADTDENEHTDSHGLRTQIF